MTTEPQSFFTDPMSVFGFLGAMVALIFWLSGVKKFEKFFEYVPPVIFIYFVPMIATTLGITPASSQAYDFTTRYFLPLALFLLMISVDLKSVVKLGPMALFMVTAGTVGIMIGGPIALMFFGSALPEDAWTGFAALSGSWIGGTANMVAIKESVGTPDSALGPIIVVDTVVGYGWMGILLFFSVWQKKFDAATNARTGAIEETNARLAEMDQDRHPTNVKDSALLIGMGMAAAVLCVNVGGMMPALGDPTVISSTTWAVLIVVTGGLLLSFTPLRNYEKVGASQWRPEGSLPSPCLPGGGSRLDCHPRSHSLSGRPHRPSAPLLRRNREHGQHRWRGDSPGSGRRVPPGNGSRGPAHGGRGVCFRDLRRHCMCLAPGAGGFPWVDTRDVNPAPKGGL